MIYSILISEQAENDLRSIFDYIATELLAPESAASQLSRLETGINSLEQLPRRFQRYQREPWKSRGLRMMPVDHYIVFYLPDDNERSVTVLRVMYSARDFDNLLQ